MGRMFAVLDPDGYDRPEEPGFYWDVTGGELNARLLKDRGYAAIRNNKLYCPEGSDWLMPLPRQWDPLFYQDSRLADHVVTRSLWTFAGGVVTSEFELTRKGDGTTHPANKWLNISKIPTGTASLDTCDYGALWTAADLGSGMPGLVTIGYASASPAGPLLSDLGHPFLPMLQWSSPPPPDDVLVFGWSHFAFVLCRNTLTVCRALDPSHHTWEKLGPRIPLTAVQSRYQNPQAQIGWAAIGGALPAYTFALHSLKALQVGWNDLFLYPNAQPPVDIRLRETPGTAPPFPGGSWWLGAAPGFKTWLQAQVMGFEIADTGTYVTASHPWVLWDLGDTYKPTVGPSRWGNWLLPSFDPDDSVTTDSLGIITHESPGTGCSVSFSIADEAGNVLTADGTHQKGGVSLTLIPGSPSGSPGAYLAPQVKLIELQFPVKLTARLRSTTTLNDHDFRRWKCSVGLEPNGKSFELDLKESGATAFYAAGLDKRGTFPIHMMEDTDDDGEPDTIRCRAWIKNASLTVLRAAPDVLSYRLHGVGLIDRMDRKPAYLPQLNHPLNDPPGIIEHTYVAQQIFLSGGMDPDTADYIAIATDVNAGTTASWLPGTWGRQQGTVILRNTSKAAPDWDETWLQYLERLAKNLFSWVIYESLDTIRYHPDVMSDVVEIDASFFVAAEIYRSRASALAAGHPWQYVLADGTEDRQEPRANRIRACGKDHEDQIMPWVLDGWEPSWTDILNENFTGEPITLDLVPTEAADLESLARCARVFLTRLKRRRFLRSETIPLAPWQISGPAAVDVGAVVRLEGQPKPSLITHLEVEQTVSGPPVSPWGAAGQWFSTRITTDRFPLFAAEAPDPKDYPGGGEGVV